MTVLLVLTLFVVLASAHNITLLEVPQYGDPRRAVDLSCKYSRGLSDPPLHSVKWYRDNNEIFRYTPGQLPSTRTFNTTQGSVDRGTCNPHSCTISVLLPRRFNTKISYTCEVSTEGPRFEVVKETKSLTVAVIMKTNPLITGVPGSVQQGEELILNCSTPYSMPPANIVWYIDGNPEMPEPWLPDNTGVSVPDEFGLRTSWRPLRLRITAPRGQVNIRCEATQPTLPPYKRHSNTTIIIATSPHLSMFTAYGSKSAVHRSSLIMILMSWFIQEYSKSSAFSDTKTT